MCTERLIRFVLITLLLTLPGACAYTQSTRGPDSVPNEKPGPSDRLCVMLPPDISRGSKTYFSDGKTDPENTVAYRVFTTLSSKRPSTMLVETSNEERALAQCSASGARYLVSPLIRRWQWRASEFSFMRNIAEIEIKLIRVDSRTYIRSVVFEARESWFNSEREDPAILLTPDSLKQSLIDLID